MNVVNWQDAVIGEISVHISFLSYKFYSYMIWRLLICQDIKGRMQEKKHIGCLMCIYCIKSVNKFVTPIMLY